MPPKKYLLSENLQAVIDQVLLLFDAVDMQAQEFKKQTGIRCPEGCGTCCAHSKVETTVIEMLPLAAALWEKDQGDFWLDKIRAMEKTPPLGNKHLCVFFDEASPSVSGGCCRAYAERPLICRLFGFFTVKDKHDQYVYGSCKVIKETQPENYQKAISLIAKGFHPSTMTDYTIPIISMGSDLGNKMMPINQAAKIALEKIGFFLVNSDRQQDGHL